MTAPAPLQYLHGLGNYLSSEAIPGTLPERQNSPQRLPGGLYAEQWNTTAFTAPRHENTRTWVYRLRPSVGHGAFEAVVQDRVQSSPLTGAPPTSPTPMRWSPQPMPEGPTDFVDGMVTLAVNGDANTQVGCSIHLYAANRSMGDRVWSTADGELLILPQTGGLRVRTEMGVLDASPGEALLIPRGMRIHVALHGPEARGYICENHGAPFRLPGRGPIGANSMASERHFRIPVAALDPAERPFEWRHKFQGHQWRANLDHSPFDVVAWHGNMHPSVYELSMFQAVGSIDFDHPDPSIFTVLTSPTDTEGMANIDFVIFPPRWMVADHTFRPPYFHRNIMSELMGLIHGVYDAKSGGFVPGGASLHNCMTPHGPDRATFEKASDAALAPEFQGKTLAFMIESRYPFQVTDFAQNGGLRQADYLDCWAAMPAGTTAGE